MLLVKPLCTVAEVRTEVGNPDLAAEVVEAAINATTPLVEQVLGRRFDFKEGTEELPWEIMRAHDVVSGDSIWLPLPARTLTSVTVAGFLWTADEDYVLTDTRRIVAVRGYWWKDGETLVGNSVGTRIQLVGLFGYAAPDDVEEPLSDVEHNVRRAAVLIAANLTSQNHRDVIGIDGQRQTLVDKWIPKPALQLLSPPGFVV